MDDEAEVGTTDEDEDIVDNDSSGAIKKKKSRAISSDEDRTKKKMRKKPKKKWLISWMMAMTTMTLMAAGIVNETGNVVILDPDPNPDLTLKKILMMMIENYSKKIWA